MSKYGVFSGLYFPVFLLKKTPYLDIFHAVKYANYEKMKTITSSGIYKTISYNGTYLLSFGKIILQSFEISCQ